MIAADSRVTSEPKAGLPLIPGLGAHAAKSAGAEPGESFELQLAKAEAPVGEAAPPVLPGAEALPVVDGAVADDALPGDPSPKQSLPLPQIGGTAAKVPFPTLQEFLQSARDPLMPMPTSAARLAQRAAAGAARGVADPAAPVDPAAAGTEALVQQDLPVDPATGRFLRPGLGLHPARKPALPETAAEPAEVATDDTTEATLPPPAPAALPLAVPAVPVSPVALAAAAPADPAGEGLVPAGVDGKPSGLRAEGHSRRAAHQLPATPQFALPDPVIAAPATGTDADTSDPVAPDRASAETLPPQGAAATPAGAQSGDPTRPDADAIGPAQTGADVASPALPPAAPQAAPPEAATATPAASATGAAAGNMTPFQMFDMRLPDWQEKLVQRIHAEFTAHGGGVDLTLTPEHLGPLHVRLDLNNGAAQVHFITETAEAARVLQQSQNQLSDLMSKAGLNLAGQDTSRRDPAPQDQRPNAPPRPADHQAGASALFGRDLPISAPARRGLVNLLA